MNINDTIFSIFAKTPDARILIATPFDDNAGECASFWSACQYRAICLPTRPKDAQIIVGTPTLIRRDLRYLGFVDLLIVDECDPLLAIVEHGAFKETLEILKGRNPLMHVHVIDNRTPLFGIPEPEIPTWVCGDLNAGLPINGKVRVSHGEGNGSCGHKNLFSQYFCRNCGKFRGYQK